MDRESKNIKRPLLEGVDNGAKPLQPSRSGIQSADDRTRMPLMDIVSDVENQQAGPVHDRIQEEQDEEYSFDSTTLHSLPQSEHVKMEMKRRIRRTNKFSRLRNGPTSLRQEMRSVDSLDYALAENEIKRREMESRDDHADGQTEIYRWLLTFIVAVVTALTAVSITYVSHVSDKAVFNLSKEAIEAETSQGKGKDVWFISYMSVSVICVLLASLIVTFIEPVAAGSGVPEIKSMLNGIAIKRSMRIRTLFSKAIGIVLSVTGGLPVGKAGTMIHCGAICGAGLSQGKSSTFGFDTSFSRWKAFRNDKEKRDFIACGAAAGIAAAFGAPLGGVMFCLEEGASYWSPSLTWRSIFAAMISAFVADLFMSGISEAKTDPQ